MRMAGPAAIPSRTSVELKRQIGLYAATAITVGNIIGSGIFRSPHTVAQQIGSFPLVIFAWVLGGLLSICGSLVLAELAVTHPKTGGLYVFIRESFGDTWAFVFGWANLWVIKPTVIASITSVFALYFCQAVRIPKGAEFPVGVAAILLLTFINWLGVKEGAGTQSLFTTLNLRRAGVTRNGLTRKWVGAYTSGRHGRWLVAGRLLEDACNSDTRTEQTRGHHACARPDQPFDQRATPRRRTTAGAV